MWLQHFYGEWWPGSGGVLSNFAFRFNLRFCCLQICSDCGLYQEIIDINSTNHYPHLPRGRRLPLVQAARCWKDFNPHLPRGRRRYCGSQEGYYEFISTHASLARGDTVTGKTPHLIIAISTHASLTGGDKATFHCVRNIIISTHASLAGGDCQPVCFPSGK